MRRQDDAHDRVGAAGERALDRLRDPRLPVLHADVDRSAQLLLEGGALRLGHVVERRAAADPPIALGELLDGARREIGLPSRMSAR